MTHDVSMITIDAEPPDSDDARYCIDAYFAELAARFEEGFDPGAGGAAADMSLAAPDGCLLVARMEGRPVGCGGVKKIGDGIFEIKRMWVAPQARGFGLSRRLLAALEDFAIGRGAARIRLDTNRVLAEAQSLYRKAGYSGIERYNDNPYAHLWFERVVG